MRVLVIVCSLFFFCTVKAQENTLLWEIKGPRLSSPSYLFGTMHVKDNRAFKFHDSLFYKMKTCEIFAGELVLDKQSAKEVSSDLLFPKGQDLKQLITKSEYKRIKKYANKHLGIFSLLINKIKPVFTSALISESLLGNEQPMALDEFLQVRAKEYRLALVGLETIQDQLSLLDGLTLLDQAMLLVEQVNNIEEERKELHRMANLYANQQLDSLLAMIDTPDMQGEFGDALLKNRNITMAEALEGYMLQKPTFCALGAAHLPGEQGILALLVKKGYSIRPLIKPKGL